MNWSRYALPVFLLVSFLSFLPSIGAGFVFDFVGWQRAYAKGDFTDIINSFGYKGNHQFLHLVYYSFYRIFHIQGLPWYLFFCTLHAINGFLIYRLALKLATKFEFNISPLLALSGTVLYLIHPYNVEAVVWKPCVHYLLSMMAISGIILLFLKYLEDHKNKFLLLAGIVYFISLFTLEISFITPVVISITGLIYIISKGYQKKYVPSVLKFAGLLFLLLGVNLLINKITLGSIVGHYGAELHFQFDFLYITGTEFKYLVKHLFFARYFSFQGKDILFDGILSFPEVTFFLLCLFITLAIIYLIKIKKVNPKWHVVFLGLTASFLYVLPVSNMYFMHLHVGMNDRFSYVPVAFLVIALMTLLSDLRRWMAYSLMGLLIIISLYFQQKTISYWHQSTKVLQSLKKDFRWHDAPYVFVLNSPDNYHGIFMTSIIEEPSGIDELIDFQTSKPFNGEMFDVFQYNMTSMDDGVKVEQTGPMQLKVTFSQWGNWWHRNAIGATSYENEYYKAELLEYPYQITFKQFPPGGVIIYQEGRTWKEFRLAE